MGLGNTTWNFDRAAPGFDDHIARSVPLVQEQREYVARLARFFLRAGGRVYELGVSTGRLAEAVLRQVPERNLSYIGLDNAEQMVEAAGANLAGDLRFRAEQADIVGYPFEPASFIVSFYTLQFVPVVERAGLLASLYRALEPGGALVLYDKTLATNPRTQDLVTQLYHEFKLEQGFTADEVMVKAKRLQGVAEPRSTDWNVAALRTAGFATVDIIFHSHCFEGYLAIKEPT